MALTSPLTPAQEQAKLIVTSVHSILTQAQNQVTNGLPARNAIGNQPAVAAITPADLQAALGSDLAILQTLFTTAL